MSAGCRAAQSTGFFGEALFGFVVASMGALVYAGLVPLAGADLALRLLIAVMGLVLVAKALSGARTGRVIAVSLWIVLNLTLFALDPEIHIWLAIQLGGLWLLRSLVLRGSLIGAGLDGLLLILASIAAFGALMHTHSLFLGLWCFFLIQTLGCFIPVQSSQQVPVGQPNGAEERFERAWRNADAALRRLSVRQP